MIPAHHAWAFAGPAAEKDVILVLGQSPDELDGEGIERVEALLLGASLEQVTGRIVDMLRMHSVLSVFRQGSVTPLAAQYTNQCNAQVTHLRHKFRTYNIPDSFPVVLVPWDPQHTPVMNSKRVGDVIALVAMCTLHMLSLL